MVAVPGSQWDSLNLTPSDSTTMLAARYTGRLNVVFKLQKHSARSPHIDAHYVLAFQKYGCDCWVIFINDQLANSGNCIDMISADDRAPIIVGEQSHALAPVAHMRTTLATADAPASQALDHDTLKKSRLCQV